MGMGRRAGAHLSMSVVVAGGSIEDTGDEAAAAGRSGGGGAAARSGCVTAPGSSWSTGHSCTACMCSRCGGLLLMLDDRRVRLVRRGGAQRRALRT